MSLATADTIVLDPSAVATDRTALTLTGAYGIQSADYGTAEVEQYLAAQQYGSNPVGHRIPNREVRFTLKIEDDGSTGVGEAVKKLQQKVALFQAEGGWLGRTLNPVAGGEWGDDVVYADVVDARLTLPSDWLSQRREVINGAELTLTVKPDFYGAEAAGQTTTASSDDHDSIVFTETAIDGDYPARSRYVVSDTGSQARQAVLIASQAATYGTATTEALTYEAEALTALDDAAGTAVSGAHGGTAVVHYEIGPQWTPILSTQIGGTAGDHMTHWGNYRLYARCYAYDEDAYIRLTYSAGDSAAEQTNAAKVIPAADSDSMFTLDLGEVRIPKATVGSQRWRGVIRARTVSDDEVITVGVDKLWLAPTESVSVIKARSSIAATLPPAPDAFAARDEFSHTAGTLSGKTPPVGAGNWTEEVGTGNFMVTSDSEVTRTAVSDAGTDYHRAYVAGQTYSGNLVVQTDLKVSAYAPSGSPNSGGGVGVGKRIDGTNFIAAAILIGDSSSTSYFLLSFGAAPAHPIEVPFPLQLDAWYTMAVRFHDEGLVSAWIGHKGSGFGTPAIQVFVPECVSGESHYTGYPMILDIWRESNANTRTYDNFAAYEAATDAACLSDGDLYARWDGAWRETEDSGIYAPAHVEGNLPRAPVSGLESRTIRTLVLPTAGDFDTLPDTDPESFTVASYHRPAFLQLPE